MTRRITTRQELLDLAQELGVREDWHEPDEQGVVARFGGSELHFDNAGFASEAHVELHMTDPDTGEPRYDDDKSIARVNLATLFAWATGYESDDTDEVRRLRADVESLQASYRRMADEAVRLQDELVRVKESRQQLAEEASQLRHPSSRTGRHFRSVT